MCLAWPVLSPNVKKIITLRRTAVRETGVPRHHDDSMKDPSNITIIRFRWVQGGFQLGMRDHILFDSRCKFFAVRYRGRWTANYDTLIARLSRIIQPDPVRIFSIVSFFPHVSIWYNGWTYGEPFSNPPGIASGVSMKRPLFEPPSYRGMVMAYAWLL